MESRAKLLGHPIHQMLIVFPLGLLVMAVIFDALAYFTGNLDLGTAAYWMIAAGVISGLVAAVFGAIDFMAIPDNTRAKRVGMLHGAGNVVVVLLFAIAFWMRMDNDAHLADTVSFGLMFVATLIGSVTGWLGGELVDRLAVGVDPGAHLNSPSSLSGRPAHEDDASHTAAPTAAHAGRRAA